MRTVVLNAEMIPTGEVPVTEAVTKVVQGKAYTVEAHPEAVFRSRELVIPAPVAIAMIRYVRLHLGDGDEARGRAEIDKAWVEALKPLLDVPPTDRAFILDTLATKDAATLAHLFFHLHFYFVQRSGEWIHDGDL